jgi:hypothetical protein
VSDGIRPRIALGVGCATLLLLAALRGMAGRGCSPEPRTEVRIAPAPRPSEVHSGPPAGVRFAGRLLEPSTRRPSGPPPARAEAPGEPAPLPELRSAELVGLEREAARRAEGVALVDPDGLDAALASLPRLPGEAEAALRRRLEDERERLLSREFLLQYRLAQLFASTEYPPGFDLERDVVAPERQRVAELPAGDRLIEIQNALESWEPGRASPRFGGDPDPTLAWQIGRPEL